MFLPVFRVTLVERQRVRQSFSSSFCVLKRCYLLFEESQPQKRVALPLETA